MNCNYFGFNQAEEITGGAVLAILKTAKTADDILKAVDEAVKNAVEEDKAKGGTGTKVKAKASNAGVIPAQGATYWQVKSHGRLYGSTGV